MASDLIDLGQSTAATAHPSLPPVGGAPLDPSIPLKLTGAQPGAGLGQIADFADAQSKMTAAKQAQAMYAARVKAGQILAQSPDLETGLVNMSKDPTVGQFFGEISAGIRQGMLAQTQQAGEQQKQALDVWGAVKTALPALGISPTEETWKSITGPALSAASPSARTTLGPALNSLKESLIGNLAPNPTNDPGITKANQNQLKANIAGLNAGSPDVMALLFGKPKTQDLKGSLLPGMENQLTGAFTSGGTPLSKSLAPQTVTGPYGPGGATTTTIMGGGNGLGGGGSGGTPGGVARTTHAPDGTTPGALPGYHFAPNGALIGPDQSTSEYNTKRADDIVDYEKSLDDRVQNGSTLRKNIDATIGAARVAQTGGGAEAYTKLGQALQAIGVKTPTVDKWANGSLASSQVIDKVALQDSMSQLKQQLTGFGGSRLNAQEFVAYLNKNPNLTTDPRAMVEIFQLWNQFYDRDKTEQKAFDAFKSGKSTGDSSLDKLIGGNGLSSQADIKRWPALWNQSDFMTKFAPGRAIDTSGVRGASPDVPDDIAAIMAKHGKAK